MSEEAASSLSFGATLKRTRRSCGQSQEELAGRAGYSTAYISMLERGERAPTAATAELLAAALDLTGPERAAFLAVAGLARRHNPTPAWAAGPEDAASPDGPLVAREPEMATLTAALDAALTGTGQVVTLTGEPGAGKTRLAHAFLRVAASRGARIAVGRCYESQRAVAFAPIADALGRLMESAPRALRSAAPARWPLLLRLFPQSAETGETGGAGAINKTEDEPGASPTPASPADLALAHTDQRRLWWQALDFLQANAAVSPLIVFLDDLHWADEASLDLLAYFAHNTRSAAVLLLGAYRDTEVHSRRALRALLSELRRERPLERVAVDRLSVAGTAALAASELGGDITEELGVELQRATEGNPFFTLETVRLLRERGDLARDGAGAWRRLSAGVLEAPETVREAVTERAGRLRPGTRAALDAASVLGQVFASEPLRRMLAADADGDGGVDDALEEAYIAGLIVEAPQDGAHGASGGGYGFSHALAHRAFYAAIPTPRRRRLHLAAANALEAAPPGQRAAQAAELARHLLEGDATARALPYIFDAGERAARLFAWGEQEQSMRLAADLARELGDTAHEAEALGQLATALALMNRCDEAIIAYNAANRLLRAAEEWDALTWNIAMMARPYCVMGRAEEGMAALTALLVTLAAGGAPGAPVPDASTLEGLQSLVAGAARRLSAPVAARVCLSLCIYQVHVEQHEWAAALGEEAVARARAAGATIVLLRALGFLAESLITIGHMDQAAPVLRELRAIAREADDPEAIGTAASGLGYIAKMRGDFAEASREFATGLEAAKRSGIPDILSQAWQGAGDMAFYRGAWDEARACYVRAEEVVMPTGMALGDLLMTRIRSGQLLLAQGHAREAQVLLETLAETALRNHNSYLLRRAVLPLAEDDLLRGQPRVALARLSPLIEDLERDGIEAAHALPLLAWALAETGDLDRATTLIEQYIARAVARRDELTLVDALRVRALVAMRQGRWDEARAALADALGRARAMPYPYAEVRALYATGQLHVARGEIEPARARFDEALAICGRLGERLYAARIESDLAGLPGPTGLTGPSDRAETARG